MLTADTITDEQIRLVADLLPSTRTHSHVAGALGASEPNRNHSRAELARLWNGLACASCARQYLDAANHPTGCIFVGWGHGWQPCQTCGGSGLSALGNSIIDARRASEGK